jgi:glycosyltransferase involved in cell wall biosynthesis
MQRQAYRISAVVPVYDEAASLRAFHERATKALEQLPGARWELIYVDDGSADGSSARLADFAAADPRVRVVKLSRNFGQQVAITAGLDRARGDCAVVLDADLQDPPELIPRLVEKWREGYEVVYGVRSARRGEGALKRVSAAGYYRLLERLAGYRIPRDAGDFRLLSRRALTELRRLREKRPYVRGLVSWIGLPQTGVRYVREERVAGRTKYATRRMLALALDGITSASTAPLRVASALGLATCGLALLYLTWLLVRLASGSPTDGWAAAILAAVLLLGGIQLVSLGVVGEYLARLFRELQPRPLYVVERELGVSSDGDADPGAPRPER